LAAVAAALAEARSAQAAAEQTLERARRLYSDLQKRQEAAQQKLATVRETYDRHEFKAPPDDPVSPLGTDTIHNFSSAAVSGERPAWHFSLPCICRDPGAIGDRYCSTTQSSISTTTAR